jgi:hypothetical protein
MFKLRNRKVYGIEASGYMTKHGVTSGWEQPRNQMPRISRGFLREIRGVEKPRAPAVGN